MLEYSGVVTENGTYEKVNKRYFIDPNGNLVSEDNVPNGYYYISIRSLPYRTRAKEMEEFLFGYRLKDDMETNDLPIDKRIGRMISFCKSIHQLMPVEEIDESFNDSFIWKSYIQACMEHADEYWETHLPPTKLVWGVLKRRLSIMVKYDYTISEEFRSEVKTLLAKISTEEEETEE